MATEDKLLNTNLGLKGNTPLKGKGTDISSDTHVIDPTPGQQGDEIIVFQSIYAPPSEQTSTQYKDTVFQGNSNFETPNGIIPD